jgi:hypothetical protein
MSIAYLLGSSLGAALLILPIAFVIRKISKPSSLAQQLAQVLAAGVIQFLLISLGSGWRNMGFSLLVSLIASLNVFAVLILIYRKSLAITNGEIESISLSGLPESIGQTKVSGKSRE